MNNLVNYSSSDDESETESKDDQKIQQQSENLKRKINLPMLLPVEVKKPRITDQPDQHQNRVRSIPHIEGNWASHIYIDYLLSHNSTSALSRLADRFKDLHEVESPHISLSKTFILRYHWIDNFFSTLREKFKRSSEKLYLSLSSNVVYFSNEDKTRHFACIVVDEAFNEILSSIVEKVDSCLKEFNLPTYYDDPSFHVSVLWKLEEFSDEEKLEISQEVCKVVEFEAIGVEKISLKTGNKLMEICL